MDSLNIIFGIVTCSAFGLSIYQFIRSREIKITEKAKADILLTRIQANYTGLHSILTISDLIVQRAKERNSTDKVEAVTIDELQSLGRAVRAQAYTLARELQKECGRLRNWKIGLMTPEVEFDRHLENDNIVKNDEK